MAPRRTDEGVTGDIGARHPGNASESFEVFNPRGRAHIEECIDGPRRDIIIELK